MAGRAVSSGRSDWKLNLGATDRVGVRRIRSLVALFLLAGLLTLGGGGRAPAHSVGHATVSAGHVGASSAEVPRLDHSGVPVPRPPFPATTPTPTGFGGDALLGSGNLLNGTFAAGYRPAPDGLGPSALTVDSGKQEVFVADAVNSRVTVFNLQLTQLLATIPVGKEPLSIVYDPAGGEVFVANYGSDNVSIINDTSLQVVDNVNVGAQSGYFASAPTSVVYASTDKDVFVAEEGAYISPCCTYNVTEISGQSNAIVRVITTGAGPFAQAYDPSTNLLYVLNYEGGSVSIVNAGTGAVVGTVALTAIPLDIAIDPSDGVLAIATYPPYGYPTVTEFSMPGNSLTVLNGAQLPSFSFYLEDLTYDSDAGLFLVAGSSYAVFGVNPLSAVLSTYRTADPCASSLNYFASPPTLLVSDACANRIFAMDPATIVSLPGESTGVDATAVSYIPGNGDLFVADGDGNSVVVENATTLGFVAHITVGYGPSSFAYDPADATTYVLCDDEGANASVYAIADGSLTVTASIPLPDAVYFAYEDTIAYDPSTSMVYVVGTFDTPYGFNNENLTVIDPSTHAVVGSVYVSTFSGGTLAGGFYDRATLVPLPGTLVAVSDPWDGKVFGVYVNNGTRAWTWAVGGTPTFMALDPFSQDLDVALAYSSTISEADPMTGAALGAFTLSHTVYDFAFDSVNGRLYATETGTGVAYVESINDPSGHLESVVDVPSALAGVTYLPPSGLVAVAGSAASSVFYLGSAMVANAATISPAPQVQDEPLTVSLAPLAGFPPYTFVYTGLPKGCASSNTSLLNCTPTQPGNSTVSVTVRDQAGESLVRTVAAHVEAYALNVSLAYSPSSLSPKNGTSVALTADLNSTETAQVGSLVNYTWRLSPTSAASFNRSFGGSVSVSFKSPANVTVSLTSDLNGTVNITSVLFKVQASPSGPTGPGQPVVSGSGGGSNSWILYAVVLAIVAAAIGVVLYLRRGRARPSSDESEPESDAPVEPTAEDGSEVGPPPIE
jgi:YVTN family beta-propeller protein